MIGNLITEKNKKKVIQTLKKIKCRLIEPQYQKKIDENDFRSKLGEYFSPDVRVSNLKGKDS